MNGPLPCHSSTFRSKNVALLLLLSLSLEQTFASLHKKVKQKLGVCPRERAICKTKGPNMCKDDFSCIEFLKCCSFGCGKKCMDPYQEPCMASLDPGHCGELRNRWYYDLKINLCKPFKYGGCAGNANNFLSKEDCKKACSLTDDRGQCPLFPSKSRMECLSSCLSDHDCPDGEKCCDSMCGFVCTKAWTGSQESPNLSQTMIKYFKVKCLVLSHKVKTGSCPQKPQTCPKIGKPRCTDDHDCQLGEKCCSLCGLKCVEPEN
ncbi:PREDICTED: WAP four-disulfide core domain protein 8 [Miniopterus natalensis]|uniref:WAP four-disulfide core domain protein 8 n=1 Tax=Miniopterus natalensis TaxID=291302 RepID=UPI0007A6E081|nr:PREDICTED: WAP four-disulfide core domain protein 8 [Miniopterus natalensis]